MSVIIPRIDALRTFMEHLKKQNVNKRQKEISDEVVKQFESLLEYSQECTDAINQTRYGASGSVGSYPENYFSNCRGYEGDGG